MTNKIEKLKEYLNSKKCFKLILGAGNKNYTQIKKLSALYSACGCVFFDVGADKEAICALKEGLYNKKEAIICASITVKDDEHIQKFEINKSNCKKCAQCEKICPQNAIKNLEINKDLCISCKKCYKTCKHNAITKIKAKDNFKEVLDEIINENIDMIEFHISSKKKDEIIKKWKLINEKFKGALSICVSRKYFGDEKLISLLKKMKKLSNAPLLIIQADGIAISGENNEYKTTLQAVATADIIERAKITDYILLSGGVNSKTFELIKLFNLNVSGISAGSWARKIVENYTKDEDFLYNKEKFEKAKEIAKKFINND